MNWNQGEYNPMNPKKVIGIQYKNPFYRSGWERSVMLAFDQNPKILRWGSEIYKIPYLFSLTESKKNYYVDFYVEMIEPSDNTLKKFLIEVKPNDQLFVPVPPKKKTPKSLRNYRLRMVEYQKNINKWQFASTFSTANGMTFIIMTEKGTYVFTRDGLVKVSDTKNF